MDQLLTMDALTSLLTLTAMEIILGIDNIVFIAIVVSRLPATEQSKVRSIGISMALLLRIGLLFTITWIMGLTQPWFNLFGVVFSGRETILLCGGLFLMAKATREIHLKIEGPGSEFHNAPSSKKNSLIAIGQILILDLIFSLDSVITAVGMASQIPIMVIAMVIAVFVMLVSSKSISEFVEKHPTIKILALSFLLLIGVMLVVEGMGGHISKGYIYFAMAFSLGVELLNMRYRKKTPKAVGL